MKMKKILLIGLAVIMIFAVFACGDKEDNQIVIPDDIDMDLIMRVGNAFNEILKALNDKNYEKYVSYYNVPEADKNLMLEGLKNSNSEFTWHYTVYNVWAMENEDGTITATVVIDNKSTSKENNTVKIMRETNYYLLSESSGYFYIEAFENGMMEYID